MLEIIATVGVGLLAPAIADAGAASEPVQLRHRIGGNETVATVAARYGDDEASIRERNELLGKPKRGTILRIEASRTPPPRLLRKKTVGKKDNWTKLASRWAVAEADLKKWNPRYAKRKRPPSGATLTMWVESGVTKYPLAEDASAYQEFDVRAGGYSVGKPHRGRLKDGVALPKSDLYTIRFGWQSFGSTVAVTNIQRGIEAFRRETGFTEAIKIGAMSQKHGRRLRPHRSHQSGRDVDIRMPALAQAEGFKLESDEIDWPATWALLDAMVRTDAVSVIFVERKLFRRLKRAAMELGATDERIAKVMRSVRHSKGHTSHIHVRFECSTDAERCED